ncbi:MAG: hypothetical protein IGS03_01145 [Candidatus Sericytochromatia bacterium]|nr:hypothetical protein [Candidatus Sericytochromatia bacterium]
MGNLNVGGRQPLAAPQTLWQPQQTPPAASAPVQVPTSLPPLRAPSSPAMPQLPSQGTATPLMPFAAPQPTLQQKSAEFGKLLNSADQTLYNHVTQQQFQLLKNAEGQISGYQINGQAVTQQQAQQFLLPLSGQLHQQLNGLKQVIFETYTELVQEAQQQFPALSPQEQQAVSIQFQALEVLHAHFVNRINHVDAMIR